MHDPKGLAIAVRSNHHVVAVMVKKDGKWSSVTWFGPTPDLPPPPPGGGDPVSFCTERSRRVIPQRQLLC